MVLHLYNHLRKHQLTTGGLNDIQVSMKGQTLPFRLCHGAWGEQQQIAWGRGSAYLLTGDT